MNLIFHIIRKDFRRVWPLLAAWWAVLVLQALVPLWFFSAVISAPTHYKYDLPNNPGQLVMSADYSWAATLADTGPYFFFASVILIAVVAAMLIHEDSPGVERAHWQLLPVSRRKMVGAKLLFFAVFIGVAAPLAGIAAKMFYGLPTSDWLAGSESICLTALFWVTLAAVPMLLLQSATTRVLSLLGMLGVFGVLVYWKPDLAGVRYDEAVSARILWLERDLLVYTVIIALLRYGRVSRMICFWFTVLYAQLLIDQFLIYNPAYLSYDSHSTYSATFQPRSSHLQPLPGLTATPTETVLTQAEDKEHNWTEYTLYGKLASALPITVKPGQTLLLQGIHGSGAPVSYSYDPNTPPAHVTQLGFYADEHQLINPAQIVAGAGLGKLLDAKYVSTQPDTFRLLNYSYVPQYPLQSPPKTMAGVLHGEIGEVIRWPDLPLTTGAKVTQGTETFEFLGTQRGPGGETLVEFATRQVGLTKDWALAARPFTRDFFLLWNQARGECVLCTDTHGMGSEWMTTHDMDFTITRHGAQVKFSHLDKGTLKTLNPAEVQAWLAGAKLVRLTFTPQDSFEVPITVGPITLPAPASGK